MQEIAKPEPLRDRGGVWFRSGEAELHLGVEEPFEPARKAHPCLVVENLSAARSLLDEAGAPVKDDPISLEGRERLYTEDPFGNRIELLAAAARD